MKYIYIISNKKPRSILNILENTKGQMLPLAFTWCAHMRVWGDLSYVCASGSLWPSTPLPSRTTLKFRPLESHSDLVIQRYNDSLSLSLREDRNGTSVCVCVWEGGGGIDPMSPAYYELSAKRSEITFFFTDHPKLHLGWQGIQVCEQQ